MQGTDVVIQTEHIKIQSWPHARPDCPSRWNGQRNPCAQCYCYVCDVPVLKCDDNVLHASADGRTPDWARTKRRRRALAQKWSDIPDLVNLLVSFSVDESQLQGKHNPCALRAIPSPTSISIDDKTYGTEKIVKVLDFADSDVVDGDVFSDREANAAVSTIENSLVDSLRKVKIEQGKDEAEAIE